MLNYRQENIIAVFNSETYTLEHTSEFNSKENITRCEALLSDALKQRIGNVEVAVAQIPLMAGITVSQNEHSPILLLNEDLLAFLSEDEVSVEDVEASLTEIIVHELTHVQQILDNRLKIINANKVIWEGVEMTFKTPISEGINKKEVVSEYLDYPWEKEAFIAGFEAMVELGLLSNIEEGWRRVRVNLGLED